MLAILPLFLLPLFAACAPESDYTDHLSEVKSDIFRAEGEGFTVEISCLRREVPYASDGIACPLSTLMEATLKTDRAETVRIVLPETSWGGEMSYRSARDDFFYSESCSAFPEGTVHIRLEWGEETREISASSVRTEKTLSPEEILEKTVSAEREYLRTLTRDGAFCGEFRIRLLRRDKTYYYAGIVAEDGTTLSLLLDAESGETLARRESGYGAKS